MATIVNQAQPIQTGVIYPRSVYSRQIGCYTVVRPDPSDEFAYTAPVADRLVVKNIQFWFLIVPGGAVDKGMFWLRAGRSRPATLGVVQSWRNLVPVYFDESIVGCQYQGLVHNWSFDMDVILDGGPWRFGFDLQNSSTNGGWAWMTVQFSEL